MVGPVFGVVGIDGHLLPPFMIGKSKYQIALARKLSQKVNSAQPIGVGKPGFVTDCHGFDRTQAG